MTGRKPLNTEGIANRSSFIWETVESLGMLVRPRIITTASNESLDFNNIDAEGRQK